VAAEYGVGWDTAWAAVEFHGRPLVDTPTRVGQVRALGVDEHSYLAATRRHATLYATTPDHHHTSPLKPEEPEFGGHARGGQMASPGNSRGRLWGL